MPGPDRPERECDRLAELSALFHFAGRLHLLGRGSVSVHLDVASAAVARRAFALLRSFGVASEIRTYRRRSFWQETRYQLHVEGGLELLVRYPVEIRRAPDIDEEMTRTVLQLVESDAELKTAVSGTPKIRSAIKG